MGMYFLGQNLESRGLPLGTKTLTSRGSLRANALEVIDTVGDGWGYGKAAPRSLELWWVGCCMGYATGFHGLESRAPPLQVGQGQVSGCRCHGSCLGVCVDCSHFSRALLYGDRVWDVPPRARA